MNTNCICSRNVFFLNQDGKANSGKANTLKRHHDPTQRLLDVEPILPPTVTVASVRCDIMEEIQCKLQAETSHHECSTTKQYVPTSLWQTTIQWVHTTPALAKWFLVTHISPGCDKLCQVMLCVSIVKAPIRVIGTCPSTMVPLLTPLQ